MAESGKAGSEAKTTAVRAAHVFDQVAVQKYLGQVLEDFAGPLTVSQFASGQSNPTFLLDTPAAKYVLRKKPPGELLPSAHQVEREYRVMEALRTTDVAVPEVLHLCEDASIIGTNFFVMRYIEGRIFSHPSLPSVEAGERQAIYGAACDMLARLHNVNVDSVGLSSYGRREAFVERQLARWTKQYLASKTEEIPEMDRVIEWLTRNIPANDALGAGAALVHGDFRLDNMIFHPARPEILAVLDWELSTLGNPLSDLGYLCMLYHLPSDAPVVPGLGGLSLHELGITTEQQMVSNYLRARGLGEGSAAELRFFVAFSLFRLACIAQGICYREKQGVASSADAMVAGRMAGPCAKLAWHLIERGSL